MWKVALPIIFLSAGCACVQQSAQNDRSFGDSYNANLWSRDAWNRATGGAWTGGTGVPSPTYPFPFTFLPTTADPFAQSSDDFKH